VVAYLVVLGVRLEVLGRGYILFDQEWMIPFDVPHEPIEYVYVAMDGYIYFVEAFFGQSRERGDMCVRARRILGAIGHVNVQIVAKILHFFNEQVSRAHKVLFQSLGFIANVNYDLVVGRAARRA
jgi:hypothetical protein